MQGSPRRTDFCRQHLPCLVHPAPALSFSTSVSQWPCFLQDEPVGPGTSTFRGPLRLLSPLALLSFPLFWLCLCCGWYLEQNTVFLCCVQTFAEHRRTFLSSCNKYYDYIAVAFQWTHLPEYMNLHGFLSAWNRTLKNENCTTYAVKVSFSLLKVRSIAVWKWSEG